MTELLNGQFKTSLLLIGLTLLAGPVALGQASTAVTCYALTVGPWTPTLDGDSIYHRIPSHVRLDTASRERGRELSPNLKYPAGRTQFRGTPRWESAGDTIRFVWSNGFTPTIVTLVRRNEVLIGEAIALTDVHTPNEPPRPRAHVVAKRQSCGDRPPTE